MTTPAAPSGTDPPTLIAVPRRGQWVMLTSLVFVVAPLFGYADDHSGLRLAAGLAVAATFTALYVAVMIGSWKPLGAYVDGPHDAVAVVVLAVLAAILCALGGTLFTGMWCFVSAAAGLRLDRRIALPAIFAFAVIAAANELIGDDGSEGAVSLFLVTLGVGMLTAGFRRLRVVNVQLGAARDEIGRLAVADERLRFARDLHDLLGHSLSVVALKSELANRLLPHDPELAAEHVRDIEAVTRRALAEVREAAAGYRRPLLADELAGARTTLRAAGIEVDADAAPDAELPPDAEAVLAWAVREGATNVLRHAGARHVRIHVAVDGDGAALVIADDGCGGGTPREGSGLAGLAERVARVRGTMDAAPHADGGFRLAISVPLRDAA